jgi:hypothetical protein
LNAEKEIVSYLCTHGNTLQTDLVAYTANATGKAVEEIQQVIDNLETIGWIRKISHDKLPSKPIYISKGSLELDLYLIATADALDLKDLDKIAKDARQILQKAELEAKKRLDKKWPELAKKDQTK